MLDGRANVGEFTVFKDEKVVLFRESAKLPREGRSEVGEDVDVSF